MKDIIIFDLDGTLADCSHRRHFVEPPKVTLADMKHSGSDPKTLNCYWCGKSVGHSHTKDCETIVGVSSPFNPAWKPDWNSFFREDLIMQDKPIEATAALVELFAQRGEFILWFLTGRMEKRREITERWMERSLYPLGPFGPNLKMRKDDDFREDYIIKEEMLASLGGPERVLFAVDDRNQTVAMWRRNGITCFQCAEGDF